MDKKKRSIKKTFAVVFILLVFAWIFYNSAVDHSIKQTLLELGGVLAVGVVFDIISRKIDHNKQSDSEDDKKIDGNKNN